MLIADNFVLELPLDQWWFCVVVLIVLVFVIWAVARFTTSVTKDIDPAETDRQMLTAVRDLKTQGELTDEESRSIKSRLVDRLTQPANTGDIDEGDEPAKVDTSADSKPLMTPLDKETSTDSPAAEEEGISAPKGEIDEKEENDQTHV